MRYVLLINTDTIKAIPPLVQDPTVHLSVLTRTRYASLYKDIPEVWYVDDVANLMQAKNAALEILRRHPIDRIVAPYERSVLAAGFLRSYLEIPGLTFDQSLCFANKLVMKQNFARLGIPTAPFKRLDRLDDVPAIGNILGWPLVIKPAIGAGAKDIFFLKSEQEFRRLRVSDTFSHLEQLQVPLLAEQYIDMEAEYHCDGFIHNGQVLFAVASRYFQPVFMSKNGMGSSILQEGDPALQPLLDLHQRLVASLEYKHGIIHLQAYCTSKGFLIGEVTCRPGGGGIVEAIKMQFGISVWDFFTRSALGDEPSVFPTRTAGIIAWYNPRYQGAQALVAESLPQIPQMIHMEALPKIDEGGLSKRVLLYFRLNQSSEIPDLLEILSKR